MSKVAADPLARVQEVDEETGIIYQALQVQLRHRDWEAVMLSASTLKALDAERDAIMRTVQFSQQRQAQQRQADELKRQEKQAAEGADTDRPPKN